MQPGEYIAVCEEMYLNPVSEFRSFVTLDFYFLLLSISHEN